MASALQPTIPARTSRVKPRATQIPKPFTIGYGIVHAPKIENVKSSSTTAAASWPDSSLIVALQPRPSSPPCLSGPAVGGAPLFRAPAPAPPVLLAPRCRVVRHDRVLGPVALGGDPVGADAARDELITDRLGALLRQLHVQVLGAGVVGVAFDQQIARRILLEPLCQLVDAAHAARGHLGPAGGEEHVADREDEAA